MAYPNLALRDELREEPTLGPGSRSGIWTNIATYCCVWSSGRWHYISVQGCWSASDARGRCLACRRTWRREAWGIPEGGKREPDMLLEQTQLSLHGPVTNHQLQVNISVQNRQWTTPEANSDSALLHWSLFKFTRRPNIFSIVQHCYWNMMSNWRWLRYWHRVPG